MKEKFWYRIGQFSPPFEFGEPGGYGFYVHLDREFAKMAKQEVVGREIQESLQEIGKDRVIKKLFSLKLIKPPYRFIGDTFLAQSFNVQGDLCQLGVDNKQIESLDREDNNNPLKFYTHNVDNLRQAYALLSLFTIWVDQAETRLRDKI